MNELRTIASTLLLLFAGYIAVMNWGCVIVSMWNKWKGIDRHHSVVPLITIIVAAIAYEIYPFTPKSWIGIIAAADIGNWIMIIGLPWAIAKGAFKKGPPNQAAHDTARKLADPDR